MRGSASAALIVDFAVGEPPTAWHPTAWMGQWIAAGRTRRRSTTRYGSLLEGGGVVASGGLLAAMIAHQVDMAICRTASPTGRGPRIVRTLLSGTALKPTLSLRPLLDAAMQVKHALDRGQLDRARRALGRHLVSRDTTRLAPHEVAGAAIESVAENLSDSVVAPLLAFRAGGLSAAYFYRMINTADAMLGYHTPELEWFGKMAARSDDLLNVIPSRVAAVMICVMAWAGQGSSNRAATVALRDASRTASPNAGWPMAAMAGALDVRLTKRGHYALHDRGRAPVAADIERSCRIAFAAAVLTALLVDLS